MYAMLRNASLGSGDADDRTLPDQVFIPPRIDPLDLQNKSLDERFLPIEARQVAMSRLHTGAYLLAQTNRNSSLD
jgi:hypothetical protein